MSDLCRDPRCVWVMPVNAPESLAMYVADLHRAYECPQLAAARADDGAIRKGPDAKQ